MQIYSYFSNKTNLRDIYLENNILNTYYNMNKKLIRLTESDLHRIVKESVNKVLTEMDWKTYMNAAQKDYKAGPMFQTYANPNDAPSRNERSRRFAKAAEDALNRDYGYKKAYKSGNKGELTFSTPHDRHDIDYDNIMGNPYAHKASSVASKEYWDGGRLTDVGPRKPWDNDYAYVHHRDPESSWGFRCGDRKPLSDIHKGDSKFRDAINKGNEELNHYYDNDYEYQKGKGWQLKK